MRERGRLDGLVQIDSRQDRDVERKPVRPPHQFQTRQERMPDPSGGKGKHELKLIAQHLLPVVEEQQRPDQIQASRGIGKHTVEQRAVGDPGKIGVIQFIAQRDPGRQPGLQIHPHPDNFLV